MSDEKMSTRPSVLLPSVHITELYGTLATTVTNEQRSFDRFGCRCCLNHLFVFVCSFSFKCKWKTHNSIVGYINEKCREIFLENDEYGCEIYSVRSIHLSSYIFYICLNPILHRFSGLFDLFRTWLICSIWVASMLHLYFSRHI